MTTDERLDRYARLAIEVGVNLRPGQDVLITAAVEHAPLARSVARAAYAAGARHVDLLYDDAQVVRTHVELAPDESLGWTPPWLVGRLEDAVRRRASLVRIVGDPAPDLMSGLDGGRVARALPLELRNARLRAVSQRLMAWTVIGCPTEGWAGAVFGEPDVERLWRAVERAVRLDEPDPVQAWRRHIDRLEARARGLDERRFDRVRFRGPGTDLVVGLLPRSRWLAATI